MGQTEFHSVGYKRVSEFGLPQISGKYFLVMANQQLRIADLQTGPVGMRKWESYPRGMEIQESAIRMWKIIPVEVHEFVFGTEESD